MDQLCRDDLCKRFGLSNFTAAQVCEIHNHCTRKGYALLSACQVNYNAVARLPDAVLFTTLPSSWVPAHYSSLSKLWWGPRRDL